MQKRRRLLRWGAIGAAGLLFLGGVLVLVGAVLPWAQFPVLGVSIALPGVTLLWGAVAAALGLAATTTVVRRWPILGVILGIAALCLGGSAQQETGRAVTQHILAIENALAPINARLAEVTLPPIEPFGGRIAQRREYAGPGPLWVAWGGAVIAFGGAARFTAERLARSCYRCGTLWRSDRDVAFCPNCGTDQGGPAHCPRCFRLTERSDRFCVTCGESLAAS